MENSKTNRLDTSVSISFEFEEGCGPVKARLNESGDLTFSDDNGNTIKPKIMKREMRHFRKKGPKIRTMQELDDGIGAISGLRQLANFEVIFAIDTNTVEVGSKRISVTGFIPFSLVCGLNSANT